MGSRKKLLLVFVLLATSCAACREEEALTVFAAASLREVCEVLEEDLERELGVELRFNFAGSNVLAEQLIASTRGGVFLSADGLQLDRVEFAGRAVPGTRRLFAGNALVVVVPKASGLSMASPLDLAREEFERIALANPEAVPAGRYAHEWLGALGLWDDLEHKLVPATNVRAALMTVEAGAVDAGICYASDALASDRVRVIWRAEGTAAPRVRYHAVAVAFEDGSQRHDRLGRAAARLLELLDGPRCRAVLAEHGFAALDDAEGGP